MFGLLREQWPEYLMEPAEFGLFMISAGLVTILIQHPASPFCRLVSSELFRRALTGIAMGLTVAQTRPLTTRYATGFGIAAVFWVISALVPAPARFWPWGVAFAIDFLTPLWAFKDNVKFPPDGAHFSAHSCGKYKRQAIGRLACLVQSDRLTATPQFSCLPTCPQYLPHQAHRMRSFLWESGVIHDPSLHWPFLTHGRQRIATHFG